MGYFRILHIGIFALIVLQYALTLNIEDIERMDYMTKVVYLGLGSSIFIEITAFFYRLIERKETT